VEVFKDSIEVKHNYRVFKTWPRFYLLDFLC